MSQDAATESPERAVTSIMNFEDTELTLGLPGEGRSTAVTAGGMTKNCAKRRFIEAVDLNHRSSHSSKSCDNSESRVSATGKYPAPKAQVIGWPPVRVRSLRKKGLESECRSSKLVKVALDGAPYLRKVDLEIYSSYEELFKALEQMFSCFITITFPGNSMEENNKLMGAVKGMELEYMPTYEDKDDDWMLVGDVPWKMFIESCKRIRLMKSSEAMEFAPRTTSNCSTS